MTRFLTIAVVCAISAIQIHPALAQSKTVVKIMPLMFRGMWRPAIDQCSDMTEYGLDITATELKYYSSRSRVTAVKLNKDQSLEVSYVASADEFKSKWTGKTTLAVSGNGRILNEKPANSERMRYVKCP